jgi:EAL domain-containing protein (putative c-di-GMP-specific phosphodiesterase class I)
MVDRLNDMVTTYGLAPSNLTLEITESSMMVEFERSEAVLRRLCDVGYKIAIDDFGTGYSSLSRLKVLPVHVVKIDRAFIKNICFDKADQAVVKSIIELARVMGHTVVAEGIEDLQTWNRLAALGCDLGQGYYFARPMLAVDCRRWVIERQGPSLASVRPLGLKRVEGA